MKRKFPKIIFFLPVVPILVGCIVSFSAVDWLETSNDWIGFWGGYLGGLCTLIGVLITTNYTKNDSNEKQRLSVIPYITIEPSTTLDVEYSSEMLCLECSITDPRKKDHSSYFFDEITLAGNYKNVGLGPVINCFIRDIKIGETKISNTTSTNKMSVLALNEESYFVLWFLDIGLAHEHLNSELEIDIKFNFYFEDVLGNKYKQEVIYNGQVCQPKKDSPAKLNPRFKSIDKPNLF